MFAANLGILGLRPPEAPTQLSATFTSSVGVRLNWTNPTGTITSTEVQRRVGTAGTWATIATLGNVATYLDPIATAGTYNYQVRAVNSVGPSVYSNVASATVTPAVGEQVYTAIGVRTWTAPLGVTEVCVVCVGNGGSGIAGAGSGSGGGLGWKNSIAVIPGNNYSVTISSVESHFISSGIVCGYAGAIAGGPGGGYAGDGGGAGGATTPGGTQPGAGGAGGYTGSGGAGAPGLFIFGGNGTGGGGGGGGGGAAGGGVGIYGQGNNGGGGFSDTEFGAGPGGGGSGGSNGVASNNIFSNPFSVGGTYGGGGAYSGANPAGGPGAVRIIWGPGRSFPNNAT